MRIGTLVAVLAIIAVIGLGNSYFLYVATGGLVSYVLISSFNLVYGYGGQLSLGHTVFYAMGAYATAILTTSFGMSFWISAPLAIVAATICGLLIAAPTARLSGIYLGIGTLALGVAAEELITNFTDVTGGINGFTGIQPIELFGIELIGGDISFYVLAAVIVLAVAEISYRFTQGAFGWRLVAVRDNETYLKAVAVNPARVRLTAFVLSAGSAGLAGVMFAYFTLYISPVSFSIHVVIMVMVALLCGGSGTFIGPFIGAIVLLLLQEGGHRFGDPSLILGLGIIFFVVVAPSGVAGIVRSTVEFVRNRGRRQHVLNTEEPDASHQPSEAAIVAGVSALMGDRDAGGTLEVRNLRVQFGGLVAVNDFSITVEPGKVVGLIGANGAGKTTAVNAITGLVKPVSGSIQLGGEELRGMAPYSIAARGLVRTFQRAQMVESHDLVTNVALAMTSRKRSTLLEDVLFVGRAKSEQREAIERAWEILRGLNLESYARSKPGDVPYGVVRLAEIGRAIAQRPQILLLDEPGAGLTAAERDNLATVIRSLAASGVGVLLIDHNVSLVAGVSTTMQAMVSGITIATGTPDEVLADPRVIESYLGSAVKS
ncbi:branched-chain amino acid ABC transporter ATP-binding protein/permease [Salinibacterium sp. ZJ454]|uniref:branched-chain amino acid ABC transporter ATP-binding protein/permease n=1 Tax=Salinibacterium sp. ZJ454 TaxID=2708339 RepID=UPI001421259F|nr:branched-chain amino acid ABC transporter ATP-binding protein/permease [Salinibacterium sp. ZJ454]